MTLTLEITSRSQIERMLDPDNLLIRLDALIKASRAEGNMADIKINNTRRVVGALKIQFSSPRLIESWELVFRACLRALFESTRHPLACTGTGDLAQVLQLVEILLDEDLAHVDIA